VLDTTATSSSTTTKKEDELVYEETDPKFEAQVEKSQSGEYIFLAAESGQTTEVKYVRTSAFTVIAARRHDHRYSVEHWGGKFYIVSNREGRKNFNLYQVDVVRIFFLFPFNSFSNPWNALF
jgi:oligopeptidase B